MAPRFSVVIPVYNRADSVLPTLVSVRDQTFRDFECIVVDDGSADGEELRTVVAGLDDPRFRYLRRKNGGGSAARNTGIDAAKGEFVAFLDSDDSWLPEKLARDASRCAPNRVVFSPMLIRRAGRIVGQRPRRGPSTAESIGDYVTRGQGFVPNSTVAVWAQLAKKVRYDERLCLGDDTDFAVRLSAASGQFHFMGEARSIMADDETGDRLSRDRDWRALLEWLDRMKPMMSRRARLAFRGWHVARLAAQDGHYTTALRYYVEAFLQGAFTPSLAGKAAAQLIIPRSVYNWMRR